RVWPWVTHGPVPGPLGIRNDRRVVGLKAAAGVDLDDDRPAHLQQLPRTSPGALDGAGRAGPDPFAGDRRMDGHGGVRPEAVLDDDPLGPREPRVDLGGERVVAGDEPDGDAPGAERERVEPVFAGGPAVQTGLD